MIALLVAVAFVVLMLSVYNRVPLHHYCLVWICWSGTWTVLAVVIDHSAAGAAIDGACTAFWVWWYFKNRPPGKKRIRKLVGAKARAIRQKLVDSMPKPRPLPNPA